MIFLYLMVFFGKVDRCHVDSVFSDTDGQSGFAYPSQGVTHF